MSLLFVRAASAAPFGSVSRARPGRVAAVVLGLLALAAPTPVAALPTNLDSHVLFAEDRVFLGANAVVIGNVGVNQPDGDDPDALTGTPDAVTVAQPDADGNAAPDRDRRDLQLHAGGLGRGLQGHESGVQA